MNEARLEPILLGPLLQYFFSHHLLSHRRASPQTVASYRDAFRLLLRFLQDSSSKPPSSLRISDMDAPVILAFLDHIERERSNAIRSRNARLAAIRSFFRLVSLREPSLIPVVTRVLAIPVKRAGKRLIGHLTQAEVQAILAVPDQKQWSGQRDYDLLLTMYNTGARVSEIVSLRRPQIHFGESTFVELNGKGRKQRSIPLWNRTARCLKLWLEQLPVTAEAPLFPNSRGGPLSRDGADYILPCTEQAKDHMPNFVGQESIPTRTETHHGDAPAAIWSRPGRNRPLART